MELTGKAMEEIGDFYAEQRSNADARALPVTVRAFSVAAVRAPLVIWTPHPRWMYMVESGKIRLFGSYIRLLGSYIRLFAVLRQSCMDAHKRVDQSGRQRRFPT